MDRRLPRILALKSPMFSPKSPAIYDKYKSGCAWGLIHFFDFRQGHSHGKHIISDKKCANKKAKANGYTRNRPNFLSTEEKAQYVDDALDNKNLAVNSRKPEVKKFVEEEMSVKHQTEMKTAISEMQSLQFNPKLVGHSKDHGKASKNSKKSCHFPACGCDAATEGYRQPSDPNMADKSSNNNLALVKEASGTEVHTSSGGIYSCKSISDRKHDHCHTEINLRVHMNEAVEAFVYQKLTDGENLSRDEVGNPSKNFIDALKVLNSNKELFTKLLQDPNSLLVKHIQDLRDSQTKKQLPQSSFKTKTSHCETKEAGEFKGPAHAQMFESCDRCSSKGSDISQPFNTTVVLKAGIRNCPDRIRNWSSSESHYSLRNKQRSARPAFLSFEHMRRKFMHAVRVNKKEKCQMSLDGTHKSLHGFKQFEDGSKEMSTQENERVSASESYLYAGKISESPHEIIGRDWVGQTEQFGSGIGSKAASSTESCHRISNLLTVRHLKGKFHPGKIFSDIVNGGNEDFSERPMLRTLDRLMSLPKHDFLPTRTPGRDKELASPEMRFSPYGNFAAIIGHKRRVQEEKKSGCLSSSPSTDLGAWSLSDNEKPDHGLQGTKESISGDLPPATKELQTAYFVGDGFGDKVDQTSLCPAKVMEKNHAVRCAEHKNNVSGVAFEPDVVQNTNTNQRTKAVSIFRESEYFECSKLGSSSGDQKSSSSIDVVSSSSLGIQRAGDSDSMIDRTEQPSAISVLERLIAEDNTNSPGTISIAAGPPVEPFCVDIGELYASSLVESHLDLNSNTCTSTDKQRPLSECMRAILQISGLNWDELSRNWHFSDHMLEASLFDNYVEVWPDKSSSDRRLLSGYITEILSEIHQSYFRCSPWTSLLNPSPRLAILSKNMVHEVFRRVDWLLLSEMPQPPLQKLVEKDLAKSETWMDIRLDTEEVVTKLADSILEDLVADAAIRQQT